MLMLKFMYITIFQPNSNTLVVKTDVIVTHFTHCYPETMKLFKEINIYKKFGLCSQTEFTLIFTYQMLEIVHFESKVTIVGFKLMQMYL